jgi:hypothetical protein
MSEEQLNCLILKNSIVITHNDVPYTLYRESPNYNKVLDCIRNGDLQGVLSLVSVETKAILHPDLEICKSRAYVDGEPVSKYIGSKLVQFFENNEPYEYLVNFWRRVKKNPSENSKNQLYTFLEKHKFPITPEGNFIAYKAVSSDMMDKHSRTVQYKIGEITHMDRSEVADTPDKACGAGLHVGSYQYAKDFATGADIVLEILVDPADVVSVPSDSSFQKCRCCSLFVIGISQGQEIEAVTVSEASAPGNMSPQAQPQTTTLLINKVQHYLDPIIPAEGVDSKIKNEKFVRVRPSKLPKLVREYFKNTNILKAGKIEDEYIVCTAEGNAYSIHK